jgi:hypothetical protein
LQKGIDDEKNGEMSGRDEILFSTGSIHISYIAYLLLQSFSSIAQY